MSTVKRTTYSTTINATPDVIWHHVTSAEGYAYWASAFGKGSHFSGSWAQGQPIRFLAPSGDGMISEIAESRAHEFLSIRHLGFIHGGVDDTTSEAVKAWAPAYENYTFTPVPGGTRLVVDQDVTAEWEEHMNEAWPRALGLLKALSESGSLPTQGGRVL